MEDAALTWDRVADEYPGSDLVPQALFWAGITRYRLGKYNDALISFQRDSILSTNLEDQTSSNFWIGKTQQALGDTSAAQAAWQQTAAIDPTDYYSLPRPGYVVARSAFAPLPGVNLTINLAAERTEANSWMRVTFNLAPDTDLSTPGACLRTLGLFAEPNSWRLDSIPRPVSNSTLCALQWNRTLQIVIAWQIISSTWANIIRPYLPFARFLPWLE